MVSAQYLTPSHVSHSSYAPNKLYETQLKPQAAVWSQLPSTVRWNGTEKNSFSFCTLPVRAGWTWRIKRCVLFWCRHFPYWPHGGGGYNAKFSIQQRMKEKWWISDLKKIDSILKIEFLISVKKHCVKILEIMKFWNKDCGLDAFWAKMNKLKNCFP